MTIFQLRQIKRRLNARSKRGLATPHQLRRLDQVRDLLQYYRAEFEAADAQMGDTSP